jgi:hypothetical protein
MGKTVPTYRVVLEFEIERWRGFRKALNSKEDREAFDELMDPTQTHFSDLQQQKCTR